MRSRSVSPDIAWPAMVMSPEDGVSRAPIRLRIVDLPEPERSNERDEFAFRDLQMDVSERGDPAPAIVFFRNLRHPNHQIKPSCAAAVVYRQRATA